MTGARTQSDPANPSVGTAGHRRLRVSWILLGLGICAFGFLSFWATWHAHSSSSGPRWLQPSAPWTATLAVALWGIGLFSWYRERRGQARPVALAVVASSAVIALFMAFFPLTRCPGQVDGTADLQDRLLTPIWRSMVIFVGTTPEVFEEGSCAGGTPLAIQVARFLAMLAVFGTATALGLNLASRQLARLRARWSTYQDVVLGLSDEAMAVLRELVRQDSADRTGNAPAVPRKVLALYTEEQAPAGLQARALGVQTAPYDRERMGADGGIGPRLTHYLTKRGRVAVDRVWVFDADPFTTVDVAEAAFTTLSSATPSGKAGVPHIWAVLPERQLADSIRVRWLANDAYAEATAPTRTPVCPAETTAMELVGRTAVQFRHTEHSMVICGDTEMAESVLVELATRLWEEADLRAAWEKHCRSAAGECRCLQHHDPEVEAAELPNHESDLLVGGRMPDSVVVVAPTAAALLGQVRRSLPGPLAEMLGQARALDMDWRSLTPQTWPAAGRQPAAVVVADPVGPTDSYLGQRLLSLAPPGSVVWMPSALAGRIYPQEARGSALPDHPIQEYAKNLFLAGHAPEDAWNRIARHQHEHYRRVNFNPSKPATRRPWWGPGGHHIEDRVRRDNLASVRGTLTWFAHHGWQWCRGNPEAILPDPPLSAPPFGMTEEEWEAVLSAEFNRYSGGTVDADAVMPDDDRKFTTDTVVTILQTLQANGYEPVRPQ